eukprot:m.147369 g.147369  ORF g.147369 m.147369 type:complete len:336 (+) comp17786_c0_seq6:1112-2119(+)
MPRQHIEVGPPVHGTANDGVKPRGLGLVLPCHHVPHFSTLLAVHALSVCCKLACRRATSSPMLPAVSSLLAAADAIGLDSVLARISSAAPCLSMVSVGAPFGNMSGCSNIQGSAEGGVCGSECSREAERLWSQDSCGPRPLSTCKLLWVDTPSTALPESDHCALARLRLRMSVVSRVPLSIPCTSSFARSSAARSFFAASRSRGLICRTLEVSRVTSAQFPPSCNSAHASHSQPLQSTTERKRQRQRRRFTKRHHLQPTSGQSEYSHTVTYHNILPAIRLGCRLPDVGRHGHKIADIGGFANACGFTMQLGAGQGGVGNGAVQPFDVWQHHGMLQ